MNHKMLLMQEEKRLSLAAELLLDQEQLLQATHLYDMLVVRPTPTEVRVRHILVDRMFRMVGHKLMATKHLHIDHQDIRPLLLMLRPE
jgi:hypothetical protein